MQAIFLDAAFCKTFARSLWPSDVDSQLCEKVLEKYKRKHYDEIEEVPEVTYGEIRTKSDRLESAVQRSQSDLEYAEQSASLNDTEIVKRSPYGHVGYSGQDEVDPGIARAKWRQKVARDKEFLQHSIVKLTEHRAKVEHLKVELAAVTASCVNIEFIIERCEFEPIDVVLQVALAGTYKGTKLRFGRQIYVEVKPTVGDDYPAILRTIKAQRRRTPREYSFGLGGERWMLLVGDYVGQGVNRDQFVEIFQRSDVHVVFLDDVKGDSTKQIDANVPAMIAKDHK